MLYFYFISAARSLYRKRLFTLMNMVGLAIGIAIFFLGLEFYRYEHGFNLFHPHLDQLYRVVIKTPEGKSASSFPAIAPLIEQRVPGVRRAIRFGDNFNDGAIITYQPPGEGPLRSFREEGCVFVDPSFLDAFHFPLVEGRNELDQPNRVVISASAASRLFGREQATGRVIRLHNQFGDLSLTVSGVVADVPDQSDIRFSYLLPIRTLDDPKYINGSDWASTAAWGNDAYTTYLWLDSRAKPDNIAEAASNLWKANDPDYARKKGVILLQPVSDMHLGQGWKDDNPVWSSFGLTAIVLLLSLLILVVAWVNYVNFATADALNRAREIGIHKVVGSSRFQIILRAVAESALLTALSVALGGLLARLGQQIFNYICERPLSLYYINDVGNWLLILLVLATCSVLAGGYTGLMLSRLKPVTALQFNTPGQGGHSFLRKGLVTFQLTISCIFIGLTLVAWQQIRFMKRYDLGMNIDRLVVIRGPGLRDSTFRTRSAAFRDQIAALPFVQQFSSSGSIPGIGSGHNYSADGITGAVHRPGDDRTEYSISEVDEHFFPSFQIPLVAGRNFTADETSRGYKGDVIIINEKAARSLGYDPAAAAGKSVHWGKTFTIAGVVRDYHHRGLKDPIEPIVFIPQHNNACYTILTEPAGLADKMATVRRIFDNAYPGNSFTWFRVKESYERQYADEERTGFIAACLSVLVIAISGLGLVGLAAFTARRRTKEMGIRKVLGASVASLFVLLSSEYLWLVGLALVIATPVSWLISNRWLEGFAYRTHPGWSTWALSGLFCALFTLLTVSFHALRAAFINVVRQLRTE